MITVAPVLIKLAVWLVSLKFSSLAALNFGCKNTSSALNIFYDVLTLLLSTVAFSAAVFTVCTGAVISYGGAAK